MQLAKAVELFLGNYKPTTQKSFRFPLERMCAWMGPARELSEIKPEFVVEYFQRVIQQGGYAPATIQKHLKTLKTFFNWCVKLDALEKSPARILKGRKLPVAIDRSKAMSDVELAKLLDAVRYKPRDYALIMFLADTGCRRGGAAGLRTTDINWADRTATITEKGDKSRQIVFGDVCHDALVKWLSYRGAHWRQVDVYVFSRDGSSMRAENISLIIRRAAKVAGVRVLSSHSLRHRKGHQFSDHRISPATAATALGHSDPMITLKYYYPHDWATAKKALLELQTNPDDLSDSPPNVVNFKR